MSAETNQNEEVVNGAETANEGAATDTTTDKAAETEGSVEQLRQQLAEEQKKASGYMEGWQRARADYDNLKRRSQLEKTNIGAETRERLLVKLLPVADDFERALQSVPESMKSEPWISGVTMIEKKLKNLLDQENVVEIPALGAEFDPHLHEAVQKDEDSEGDKEVVTAVYQKGYKLGDKVIRAAVVTVGRQ